MDVTQTDKDNLVDANVTLNEIRAKISGRFCKFPHVVQLQFPYQSVEYSWPTVKRIVNIGEGLFTTG